MHFYSNQWLETRTMNIYMVLTVKTGRRSHETGSRPSIMWYNVRIVKWRHPLVRKVNILKFKVERIFYLNTIVPRVTSLHSNSLQGRLKSYGCGDD